MRSGDYQTAQQIFAALLRKNPDDLRAHLGAAFALLKLLKYDLAYDEAQAALKLDPSNARAHALAGTALLRSGYLDRSVVELVEAVRLNQREALAWGALAEIDYYCNRARESRQRALYAMGLDSKEPDYLVTFARACSRLEMFGEAADAYERYLQVAPRTDKERRDRIRGLIQFYRQLTGQHLHDIYGPKNVSIPFSLGGDRRPYIQLQVNGHPAIFVLDTGSAFTVISDQAAKRLGVPAIAQGGTSQGVGGTGKFPIIYGLISSIKLGDEHIERVPCFIRRFHRGTNDSEDHVAQGFIGLSVLSNFLTEIDYERQQLSLLRRNEDTDISFQDNPSQTIVPFRTTQNGLLSVETEINNTHSINVIVDTGASSSVISSSAVQRLALAGSIIKGETVQVVGAAGLAEGVPLLSIADCKIADLEQNNLRALVLDFGAINETSGFEQSGILGGDFLRNFKIVIDFDHGKMALRPQNRVITKRQETTTVGCG